MTKLDVLESLRLGGAVAESEADLSEYFVQTPDFAAVARGEHDLILGAKGTGKSAIFKILSDPDYEIEALRDTIMLPAFAGDGPALLQEIFWRQDTEKDLALAWKAFYVGLAANWLVVNGLGSRPLEKALKESQLELEGSSAEFWQNILTIVRIISRNSSVEGSFEAKVPGLAKATVGAKLSPADVPAPVSDAGGMVKNIHHILRMVNSHLKDLGMPCWVIVDRIDELFLQDPEFERRAVRAMLKAQLDIHSGSEFLKVKAFLRKDILERIVEDAGFTNLTHLRVITLELSADGMAEIIAQRLRRSAAFNQYLSTVGVDGGPRQQIAVCLPEKMELRKDYRSGFTWLYRKTMDAEGSINPRNVLSLLEGAALKQVRVLRSGQAKGRPSGVHLISASVCWDSYRELSKRRLADTLYAEFPELRPIVETFRYGRHSIASQKLQERLKRFPGKEDHLLRQLTVAGFLRQISASSYNVGEIYLGALNVD